MKFYSQPILKYRTRDRLHICKEPGLLAWLFLLSVTSLGTLVDYFLIPDYFILHAGFVLLCLILSLNFMKTWDLILNREENSGTMITKNWYHIFSIRVPEENVLRFPLTTITAVVVTSKNTIEIIRKNESSIKIVSKNNNYRMLKKLRNELSVFLCLERIENLKNPNNILQTWDFDSLDNDSAILDNQESDNDIQDENQIQEQSQFHYGSNIKIITGVL